MAFALIWSPSAHAQVDQSGDLNRVMSLIDQQEQRLNEQQRQLAEQQAQLSEQRALIERQRREIAAMLGGAVSDSDLGEVRGAGLPNNALAFTPVDPDQPIALNRRRPVMMLAQADSGSAAPAAASRAEGPVGEAPPEQPSPAQVEALPEGSTALGGRGRFTIEPSIDFSHASNNRLVFRGVEIVTGIQIGLIDANDTSRDTVATSLALRYAVSDRLEVEARIPYVYRSDRITTLSQNNAAATQTYELDGGAMGDLELSARYQLNQPSRGGAIFVAGARIKSDTGLGAFEVDRDQDGVATELATGSGFWGVQGSVSMLYPTDPVVLFANASYLYNIGKDIDQTVGTTTIGHVDPGDSIGAGFGFGFALNPRFSYSLGYSHAFIMETESEIGATTQRSTSLQVGTLQMGMSFRATERTTISTSVDVGVTADAPDVRISFRTPFQL